MLHRLLTGALTGPAALLLGAGLLLPSSAVVAQEPGAGYAGWTIDGGSGDYSGTVTLPPGFPAVTWTSDSSGPAAVPSGASTWLPAGSGLGASYGASAGEQYVNLRPADNDPDSPSTTTYRFASATPAAGWGFALGDIDSDAVEVTATDPAGDPVPASGLGFQGVFNYCDASPRSAACSGAPDPGSGAFDLPAVETGASAVRLVGNVDDTVGASGWFQPSVPLSSLTIEMSWQTGFPVYQTWFAAETRRAGPPTAGPPTAGPPTAGPPASGSPGNGTTAPVGHQPSVPTLPATGGPAGPLLPLAGIGLVTLGLVAVAAGLARRRRAG